MDLGLVDPAEEHPISGTISGEVAGLRRPVIVNSRNEHEYTHRLPQLRRYFKAGLVSTLSVPVVWHDRVVSVEECRALVRTAQQSQAIYMIAENYTYMKPNVLVKELVQRGLMGEVYYAEGEYLHELKELNEITPWRRRWQTGIDGITYGTHSLGPILQWMPGERVVRVCCEGSGHHYRDPRGDQYENQDSCVMLAKTTRGALIKIRVDMLSNRPHAMTNYTLQGTHGSYESARAKGEQNRIWLSELHDEPNNWHNLADLEANYLPEIWRNPPPAALQAGHGGGDYLEIFDFIRAILGEAPCPIGIHEAMDMTLPGLISQESIRQNGTWLEVPDSRLWV
jgi:predicted dehydrogenase